MFCLNEEGPLSNTPKARYHTMFAKANARRPARSTARAVLLAFLMVASTTLSLLATPLASAHAEPSDVTWPLQGSNDTGWVQLDALGANPALGTQATADWNLNFAPGAELSNVTMEIRISGQDGLVIEEPLLAVNGMGTSLFDWRGLGVLGEANELAGSNPYTGRLNPNSNSAAGWDLPSDAEITELIFQALAPIDPAVSLQPVDLSIQSSAIHPTTGRMYLAMNDDVMVLDATTSPSAIDMLDFSTTGGIADMVVDVNNNLLHLLTKNGSFHAISLSDSTFQTPLADIDADHFLMTSGGDVFAAGGPGLSVWTGSAWNSVVTGSSSGAGEALSMIEVNGVVYAALDGLGVLRYDTASSSALSTWSSANTLHSDSITHMLVSGNQLLLGSSNNGLARYDYAAGFWLSTWNSANWLDDNFIGGLALVDDQLMILNGASLHAYNTSNANFGATYDLADMGLASDGEGLMMWPSNGPGSPDADVVLVNDGSGSLARVTPTETPVLNGSILLSSGPLTDDMTTISEMGGILYIGSGDGTGIMRYDTSNAVWMTPLALNEETLIITNDGTDLFVATGGTPQNTPTLYQMASDGTQLNAWNSNCLIQGDDPLGMDVDSSHIAISMEDGGFTIIERSTSTCTTYTRNTGIPSSFLGDVALHSAKAYVATEDKGVLRYDITNDTWLEPWGSTGINGVDYAAIAVVGDILHLGLQGYGVVRKDLSTGEILAPLTANNGPNSQLPSSNIFALETDGVNLYIGTSQGARKWDGSQMTTFGQGSSWDTRPNSFFDFVAEASTGGGDLYAATNIGVCKYNIATLGIIDCQNVQDGMPDWAVYSVGVDTNNVYGGTNQGVGIITKSNFQHSTNWGEGTQTGNAALEIIGDIAYVGLDGMGVLRYNLTSEEWLTPWTEDNGVLDGGNDGVTGLVADIRNNYIWVGGGDGFQLINITTGAEVYDIEKTSSLYNGNGDPYQMMIHNNIMYYHSKTANDEVGRIDVANLTNPGDLDIGAQVGENGGDIYGMGMVGNTLMVSVASGQWWNADGSGGIAMFNTSNGSYGTNILPTGQIDRVTSHQTSTGNMWVSWGELRLDLYNNTGALINSWENLGLPIRGIVEFDGKVLFASEDGVLRYDESTNLWLTPWTAGNGLPNNAGDRFYELWTDGNDLVVGGADFTGWGGFSEGIISHLDSSGSWQSYAADSYTSIPDGYPISMDMCGGYLHVAMYNNNGGVARIDLQNQTVVTGFTSNSLDGTAPASLVCDTSDTLYIGYYNDNQPITKYSYASNSYLTSLTTRSHNVPSDRIWYDGLAYANGQLIAGHGQGGSGSNVIGGGYSTYTSSGATTTQANIQGSGSSVTSFQWLGSSVGWMIGQAGGSSGYSHVSTISSLGRQTVVDLPGIVSGQVTSMTGNSTHLWVATEGVPTGTGFGLSTGAGLLQGEFLPNGEVDWQFGWTLTAGSSVRSMSLQGTTLYMATNPTGLYQLNTVSATLSSQSGALHDNFDEMMVYNNDLVIGLAGDGGSSPGIQTFDMNTQQFTNGRLVAGLPSNNVNGFAATSTVMYIATNGGLGRWNYTSNDWMDSITTNDGLPSNIVEDIAIVGSTLMLATPVGLVAWDVATSTITTLDTSDGMMGTSVWGLTTVVDANGNTALYASHDGAGADRPGVSVIDASTLSVTSTHRFDQLPSNTVTALTSDWWGVHMATDLGPLTHWNASNGEFEDGVRFQASQYPIIGMMSDGDEVLALAPNTALLVEARSAGHTWLTYQQNRDIIGGVLSDDHMWTISDHGLQGWWRNGQFTPVDDFSMRRASPLSVRGLGTSGPLDITDMTHPNVNIQLVDPTFPYALDSEIGAIGVHGLRFQNVPLVFTSSVAGAAIWAQGVSLKYDATLDISNDTALMSTLQLAVDNGQLYNNTRHVQLRLYSPSNGSMEVRLTYDYIRNDTPVVLEELIDRPDDGGSALTASWSLVHDEDFARYLIFANEGAWDGMPTELDLMTRSPDKTISLHSRLSSEIESANGQPLVDGTDYYAVVVVEYNDGRWGEISMPVGPASPSDEVPMAPLWATASAMGSNGDDGDIELEWARCTALDLAHTNLYVSNTPFTDVFGMELETSVLPNEGNLSTLSLTPGVPVWIGFTCVDDAGQENLSDVTVVGPVVPTGELNDNEAPDPIEGTQAADIPDDEGGRISVSWNASSAEDCAFYTVFMEQGGDSNDDGIIGSVDGFSQAVIVNSCDDNQTIISSLDGVPLIDGQTYTIGVVAYDVWLNGNTDEVLLVSATPFQNIIGSGTAPERITNLLAFDHPDDDGTAIDVVWAPSGAVDFASYTVWVADQPVSDLSVAYASFGTNPDKCGCFTFDKQWIDEETNPIELTISTALYTPSDGTSLLDALPGLIQPDIELFVTVTVHDIKGNVHLTELTQATVLPIDNLNDVTPPNRLDDLSLVDRPLDDGSALLLNFSLSDAPDVKTYEVYAATYEFTDVTTAGNGPPAPIAILSRNPELPLMIDLVSGDTPVIAGQDIWAAVVVRDSSGNAIEFDLVSVKGQSEDNGVTDPGSYLPDIRNIRTAWSDETSIFVEWDHSLDAQVKGYQIYISNEDFSDTDDATMVGEVKASNSFLITTTLFGDLSNESNWYIAVSPFDNFVNKKTVEPVELPALTGQITAEPDAGDDGGISLESFLTTPNMLVAGLFIVAMLLVILIVRTRGTNSRKNKSWELQEATWGIQDQNWGDAPPAPPAAPPPAPATGITQQQSNDIYAAANQIQSSDYARPAYQPSQPVLQPQVQTNVLGDLLDEAPPKSPQIDTSFLDDLL